MDPAYDPFIPKASVQDQKTARVQRQVDDVMNVMKENIEKVQERGMKMDVLKEKADGLQRDAAVFNRATKNVNQRMWWKNMKWKIIIALTILVVLGIIIGSIVGSQMYNV